MGTAEAVVLVTAEAVVLMTAEAVILLTAEAVEPTFQLPNRNTTDAPDRIRTYDRRLRRPLLYPPELRAPDEEPPTVGAPGFEPGTSWSQTRRATKLRYAPSGAREANETLTDNQPRRARKRNGNCCLLERCVRAIGMTGKAAAYAELV
jgi:hypothetical protein